MMKCETPSNDVCDNVIDKFWQNHAYQTENNLSSLETVYEAITFKMEPSFSIGIIKILFLH